MRPVHGHTGMLALFSTEPPERALALSETSSLENTGNLVLGVLCYGAAGPGWVVCGKTGICVVWLMCPCSGDPTQPCRSHWLSVAGVLASLFSGPGFSAGRRGDLGGFAKMSLRRKIGS